MRAVPLHLASLSPRRLELLQQIGVHPNVVKIDVDETPLPNESPSEYVLRLAMAKAQAGWNSTSTTTPQPVLAADTAVVLGNEIMGKPHDREDALNMLQRLSGQTHQVLTGVAICNGEMLTRLSTSQVSFRQITPTEAETYWQSGEPEDKAGSYGIQGAAALFISNLEGSYSGVMGLPLYETGELLNSCGITPLHPTSNQAGSK